MTLQMIRVGFVVPSQREVDRFYTLFQRLTPSEVKRLKDGIPAQVKEIQGRQRDLYYVHITLNIVVLVIDALL